MIKKLTATLVVLSLLIIMAGCGGGEAKPNSAEPTQTKVQDNSITIGFIAMNQTSPQALINQEHSIFTDQLKKINKEVEFISTRSLDNIWPMMDKNEEDLDFVYIPAGNFATYVTETSRFGGSNKYTIIAGSSNSNGTVLIARPDIKSLKDLDGKKIGISNLRYADEFQLNKVLSTVALKTDSMGGTVQVVWDDTVPKLIENFGLGKYDAVVMYSASNFPLTMNKVPGSKILTSLNPDGLFGDKSPRIWLVAKKEHIKNSPELVKEVLKAHLISTDKALEEIEKLPLINREIYLKYFEDMKIDMTELLKKNTVEFYQKGLKETEITYDPNVAYVKDIFGFMDKRGLVKGKTIEDFIHIEILSEVLKEMKKPGI